MACEAAETTTTQAVGHSQYAVLSEALSKHFTPLDRAHRSIRHLPSLEPVFNPFLSPLVVSPKTFSFSPRLPCAERPSPSRDISPCLFKTAPGIRFVIVS